MPSQIFVQSELFNLATVQQNQFWPIPLKQRRTSASFICPDQNRFNGVTATSGGTGSPAQNAAIKFSVKIQWVLGACFRNAPTTRSADALGAAWSSWTWLRTASGNIVRASETAEDQVSTSRPTRSLAHQPARGPRRHKTRNHSTIPTVPNHASGTAKCTP